MMTAAVQRAASPEPIDRPTTATTTIGTTTTTTAVGTHQPACSPTSSFYHHQHQQRPCPSKRKAPRLCGAGILPFCVPEDGGEILFLLGREKYVPGWRGSNRWSAFEGGSKGGEVCVQCAVREFVEETCDLFRTGRADLERELYRGEYALRISIKNSGIADNEHITYLKQFSHASFSNAKAAFEARQAWLKSLLEASDTLRSYERTAPHRYPFLMEGEAILIDGRLCTIVDCDCSVVECSGCEGWIEGEEEEIRREKKESAESMRRNGESGPEPLEANPTERLLRIVWSMVEKKRDEEGEEKDARKSKVIYWRMDPGVPGSTAAGLHLKWFRARKEATRLLTSPEEAHRRVEGAVVKTEWTGTSTSRLVSRVFMNKDFLEKDKIELYTHSELKSMCLRPAASNFRPYFMLVLEAALPEFTRREAYTSSSDDDDEREEREDEDESEEREQEKE